MLTSHFHLCLPVLDLVGHLGVCARGAGPGEDGVLAGVALDAVPAIMHFYIRPSMCVSFEFPLSLLPDFVPEQGEGDARDEAEHEPVQAAGLAQLGGGGAHLAGHAKAAAEA